MTVYCPKCGKQELTPLTDPFKIDEEVDQILFQQLEKCDTCGHEWLDKWWSVWTPEPQKELPKIVCLCGSTRFSQAFQDANFNETLAGNIVLTIGCDMKSDNELFKNMSENELTKVKAQLDKLHFDKIYLANEVLILNVGGYIGQSTRRELEYAQELGKVIRYLEPISPR